MNLIKLNQVSKTAGIFMVVTVLQFVSSLLLLPLYFHHYTVEEFGINEIINRVALFAGFIISLRISGAMANIYFTYKNEDEKKTFIFSLFIFTIFAAVAGLLLFFLSGPLIIRLFFSTSNFLLWPHGFCALLTGIAGNLMSPYVFYLRNEQKLKPFLFINLLFLGTSILAQVVAIYFFNASFNQITTVRTVVAIVQCFIMVAIYVARFPFKVEISMMRRALRYTIPLMPFLILNWLQLYYDRFFISGHYGAVSLGIFSFVIIAGSVHSACTDVFENAFRPSFIQRFSDINNVPALQSLQAQFLLSIVLSASIILLGAVLLPLFTKQPNYLANASLFFLVVAGTVCKGISLLFIQQLVYKEKSVLLGIAVFFHFVLLWIAYNLLASNASIDRVLMINLALNVLMTVVYFGLAQRSFFIPFTTTQFITPYVYIGVTVAAYLLTKSKSISFNAMLVIQFLLTVAIAAWYYRVHKFNQPGMV